MSYQSQNPRMPSLGRTKVVVVLREGTGDDSEARIHC